MSFHIISDDVFEFMGTSQKVRQEKKSYIESLILMTQAFTERHLQISLEKTDFADLYLTPDNAFWHGDKIYLKGDLFDTYLISKVIENGTELRSDFSGDLYPEFRYNNRNFCLTRRNIFWTSLDYGIRITGSKGFVDSSTGVIGAETKKYLIEKTAVDSKMWTKIISSSDGQIETLVLDLSQESKDFAKEIRNRR